MDDRQVTLAAITGAHGIAGEVRLKLFTEDLAAYPQLRAGDRTLTLKALRPGANGAVARFAEITDRTAAEAMRGTPLTVPRAALPPLGEGEYYHADLIDQPALATDGEALGRIVAVENYGAGDLIEIERADGRRFLVPVGAGVADLGPPILVHAAFVEP
ncbi:ribosome maturation factor RimM [Sphingomonas morindae]|uniref:Ribosome maturation factor RimM n=1 Tax=Sphingomonas morindae TaxID=1541170 RepID=A0ABY4X845_9SPHN|nr:ribosome maturation factor RimM [Sphingomonas morindae]USI73076.1 ribosome maturation factor RimM [Sphingomonas morindae]